MLKFNPFTGTFDIVNSPSSGGNVDGGSAIITPNKIQLKRDTASNFTSNNPTLEAGEIAYENDTGKIKIGDGSTSWNSLDYFTGSLWSTKAW